MCISIWKCSGIQHEDTRRVCQTYTFISNKETVIVTEAGRHGSGVFFFVCFGNLNTVNHSVSGT